MSEKCIPLNIDFKELHNVKNDTCPICDKKFIYISPIVKIDNKAYHLNCYERLTGK
jgi:hypothetical protein